ncbi:MAG: SMC family ATPase [Candidatus Nanoarchaeia archaeon]|nr:SMC family ATPase [Candidatus Nanoarchaeia archaeon]
MKLKKIRLENIRSHEVTEIDFNNGVTVFTGRTGAGKSTVLMAVEYGLFGGSCSMSNNMLLKRAASEGAIILDFEHMGEEYSILRGLKRTKSGVNTDVDRISISKNQEKLPILNRVSDLNEKICEIIGYSSSSRAKELFEVTSYTRQDEIRKLIDMKPETRQEYVDNILQLSKYKKTWENLKPIIRKFESETERLNGIIESSESFGEELEKIKSDYEDIKKNYNESLEKHSTVLQLSNEHALKVKARLSAIAELEKSNNTYNELTGILRMSLKNCTDFSNETVFIKSEIEDLKKILKSVPENTEDKYETRGKLNLTIENMKTETARVNEELSKLRKNIGLAVCPLCRQNIPESHFANLEKEYIKRLTEIMDKRKELREKLETIENEIKRIESSKEISEKLRRREMQKQEKEELINELNDKIKTTKTQLTQLECEVRKYRDVREEVENLRIEERDILEEKASLAREIEFMKKRLDEINNDIKTREERITQLEKTKQRLEKFESLVDMLTKLREDIRNIREVVRAKFLQDFRHHFQNKFEDIRRSETEYYVDIKTNYEPFAFTKKGEEVPIEAMSGGEKTSVALAYRLALSDIAAQMEGVNPSEMLILDEPTVGFDKEDIKILPDMLRNIRSIPQIIIVSHEDELKNAADFNYSVEKSSGVSKISLEA